MKKADSNKKAPEPLRKQLNFSIHRAVLDETGDFLSAIIIEWIHCRVRPHVPRAAYFLSMARYFSVLTEGLGSVVETFTDLIP